MTRPTSRAMSRRCRRRGYRFIAPVDVISTSRPALAGARLPPTRFGALRRAGARSRLRVRNVVLAILALTILGAAVWAGLRPERRRAIDRPRGACPVTQLPD